MSMVVDAPGVYLDIPDATYHGDHASLSSTGLRMLLPPSTPSHFRWVLDHGQPPKKAFDFGHAAHREVTRVGARIVVPTSPDGDPYAEWRTNDAKAQVADAYAAGLTPIKPDQADTVRAMAAALREHPTAGPLLDADRGTECAAEVSLWWTDPATGVWCRARFDLLRTVGGRLVGVDYKTTDDASPAGFAKSAAAYRYDQQEAHYTAGATVLGETPDFVFVAQEKAPPYRVGLYRLDEEWKAIGWERNRRALDVYADCLASGQWPGYSTDIETLTAPRWLI